MHKVLDLNTCAFFKQAQLGQGHFPADDNAGNAVFLEFVYGVFIMRIHHDGGMKRNGNFQLTHEFQYGQVLNEQGIRLNCIEIQQILLQGG